MIVPRVLRDDALWMLPVFVVNAAMTSSVFLGALAARAARHGTAVDPVALFAAVWLGLAWFLFLGRIRTRASGLDLALPIAARRLWVGHVLAVLAAAAIVSAGPLLAVAGWSRALGAIAPGTPPAVDFGRIATWLIAGLPLAVVLLEVPRPRLARTPARGRWRAWVVLVVVGVPTLVALLARLGPAWLLAAPLAAALLGAAVYGALPGAFTVVPRDAVAPGAAAPVAAGSDGARAGWLASPAGFVLRSVSIGAKEWLLIPFIAIFGFLAGGGIGWWDVENRLYDYRFTFIPAIFYMLLSGIPLRLMNLHRLDPLPIPRRLVFALMFTPSVLVLLAGYAVGITGSARLQSRHEAVEVIQRPERVVITIPPGTLRIAWDGRPPEYAAPWGESHPSPGVPLVRGGRAVAYSPYRTPEGSSPDYVAWQLSRALSDVYAVDVPWREIRDRYVTVRPDGSGGLVEGGLTFRRDHPDVAARGDGPVLPIVVAVGLVPFLLMFAAFLRFFRARFGDRVRVGVYWSLVGMALAAWMAPFIGSLTGLIWDGIAVGVPTAMLAAWAGESFARTAVLWVVSLLAVGAAWVVAEGQFRRAEMSTRPLKLSLIDRLQED